MHIRSHAGQLRSQSTMSARPAGNVCFVGPFVSSFFVAFLWLGVVHRAGAQSPIDGSTGLHVQATGELCTSQEKARESAIEAAQAKLAAELRGLSPSVDRVPEFALVRARITREKLENFESRRTDQDAAAPTEPVHKMTLDVVLKPDDIRALRQLERSQWGAWFVGGASLLLALLSLAIRIEEWTKGYLTTWLMVGAIALSVVLAGLWWFVM
jgi:hypothetical protein